MKFKIKKNRRKRKIFRNISKTIRFLGVNAAGLGSKMLSFKKVLNDLKPSVFFVEESKMKTPGRIKMNNYVVFEKIRNKNENGGGLAIGCIPELNPIWVKESPDPIEAMSIHIFVKQFKIRCCIGYGCQENDNIQKKEAFWEYLDNEVREAKNDGSGLIIQMDGNLWAGKEIIPHDPRPQNRNGKLFSQFLTQNPNLNVVNSLSLCEGLITRRRSRNGIVEESVLDFFIVCDLILPYVTRMVIDEQKFHVLTNYQNIKKGKRATDTDHNTEYMDLALQIRNKKPKRCEIWNFNDKKGQQAFKNMTSETNELTNCFENDLPVLKQIENWKSILIKCIRKSFKKVRIRKKSKPFDVPAKVRKYIDIRNQLPPNLDVEKLELSISNIEAKLNYEKIVQNFKTFSENPEKINLQQIWKIMRKLWPKVEAKLPSAKKNYRGQLISEPNELKKLLEKEYIERLRARPVRPDFENLEKRKNDIFEMKLKLASSKKSKPWTMENLDKALSDLKNGRSRDPEGLINEIFKKNVIGNDLKSSLLMMFNKIKEKQEIPIIMNFANITTVPKKGSKLQLENERGIFRVSVLRTILMRLIYNEKYKDIDRNMSECQTGGRKGRGCRNNILIVNGIIHETISSKKNHPVVLQIYDYRQMFDAIGLKEALSDIFDAGVNDDNFTLLYEANKIIRMAVNTPNGLTDRHSLEDVVLQGDTFGSILASVQVDNICKEVEANNTGYKYKDKLAISILALVDDMLGVTKVGYRAHQMNAIINAKTAEKRLQFGVSKCKSMLIGTEEDLVYNNLLVDKWNIEHKVDEDTKEENLEEKYEGKVEIEKTEKQKYLGFYLSGRGDNMVNIHEMEKKSVWVSKKIFDRLNSLNLKQYFFECGLIFLKVILRSSILFAAETYYNLKEKEMRALERIEERFLRKLLKTEKGCPISQIYLETGHTPARFAIFKLRCMFFKDILNENPESLIFKFIMTQYNNPTRGDWVSGCLKDLQYLNINLKIEEIKAMKRNAFRKILQESIKAKAFQYLLEKRGSKGSEIKYSSLKIAEYLSPNYENLSIEDQRYIFAIRNRMIRIEKNFPKQSPEKACICGKLETQSHIYSCKILNKNNKEIPYEKIFEENVTLQKQIYLQFKKNYEKLQNSEFPMDPLIGRSTVCHTVMDFNK